MNDEDHRVASLDTLDLKPDGLLTTWVWLFSGLFHESLRHLERILDYEEVCAFNIRRGL